MSRKMGTFCHCFFMWNKFVWNIYRNAYARKSLKILVPVCESVPTGLHNIVVYIPEGFLPTSIQNLILIKISYLSSLMTETRAWSSWRRFVFSPWIILFEVGAHIKTAKLHFLLMRWKEWLKIIIFPVFSFHRIRSKSSFNVRKEAQEKETLLCDGNVRRVYWRSRRARLWRAVLCQSWKIGGRGWRWWWRGGQRSSHRSPSPLIENALLDVVRLGLQNTQEQEEQEQRILSWDPTWKWSYQCGRRSTFHFHRERKTFHWYERSHWKNWRNFFCCGCVHKQIVLIELFCCVFIEGRVERFWESKGKKMCNVRWFYHPEEVKASAKRLSNLKYPVSTHIFMFSDLPRIVTLRVASTQCSHDT